MNTRFAIALIMACLLVNVNTHAQSLKLDPATKMYIMQDVIICDSGATQKVLFERAKEWMVKSSKIAADNIEMNDPEYKRLAMNGEVKTSDIPLAMCGLTDCSVVFKMIIDVKDGKIRYTINNIVFKATNGCATPPASMTNPLEHWNQKSKLTHRIYADVEQKLDAFITELKQSLDKPKKSNDNW